MTLPELMSKIWDGDDTEYFTHTDMNRVEYNANILAKEIGIEPVTFIEVTRASQFRYDEANRLESLIGTMASAVGVGVDTDTAWSHNRSISYVDFERWESGLWTIYRKLGGVGERIQAGRVLVNYHATLFSSEWRGTGPYYIDKIFPAVHPDTEAMAFVTYTANVQQRRAEYNAVLRAVPNGDRTVRFYAMAKKPDQNINITIAIGGLQMHKEISLPAASWSGSGPWTQNVSVPQDAVDAVIGQWEGMTAEAVEQMMEGMIHVSAINGTTVTIRAIGKKPSITINPMLLYDVSNVE